MLAAGAALALAGVSLTRGGDVTTGPDRVWAAAAVRIANAVPRIEIGQSGWHVVRADEFTVGQGETALTNGRLTAELTWRPVNRHEQYVKDRANDNERLADISVLGSRAVAFRYRGWGDAYTALWRSGDYSLELRAQPATSGVQPRPQRVVAGQQPTQPDATGVRLTPDQFRALVSSLKLVSVDEWLGAMPPSVVLPTAQRTVVARMVADMALPPGFDAAAIADVRVARDRYQLGAKVAGSVACAWIGRWVDARRAGDAHAAATATAALAGSRDWAVLHEMNRAGDYPEMVWRYADAVAHDGTVLAGTRLSVADSYRNALGCGG